VSEPTPRQVLYALVAGGFLLIVLVLIVGEAVAGVVPLTWTVAMGVLWLVLAVWSAANWRRTALVLLVAIGLFLFWALATVAITES
jgi:hypothetical protein